MQSFNKASAVGVFFSIGFTCNFTCVWGPVVQQGPFYKLDDLAVEKICSEVMSFSKTKGPNFGLVSKDLSNAINRSVRELNFTIQTLNDDIT